MEPPQLQRATSSSNSADFSQYEEPEMMTRDHSFDQTCYSEAEVKAAYDRKVEDVSCMLKIAKSMARFLLARTRPPWDVEKAVETWFDEGLRSRLLGEQSRVQGDASESCLICGCLGDIVFTLTCGHAGCAECFTNFIRSQLSQRRFPPYTCKQICGRECHGVFDCEVADLPLDEADRAMISSSEATLEGEIMPFRRCPAVACGRSNRPLPGQLNLRCECGAHYCLACGQEACVHAATKPVPRMLLAQRTCEASRFSWLRISTASWRASQAFPGAVQVCVHVAHKLHPAYG